MGSSLQSVFNLQQALLVNQAALNVIGNNVANVNTAGYTKETVNIEENSLSPEGSPSASNTASLAGVKISSVSRDRDTYLDTMYRNENTSQSYYNELNTNGTSIENITNELSNSGINSALSSFYSAASTLSQNPTDKSIRNNFIQSAQSVASEFNSTSSSLTDLRTSLIGNLTDTNTLQTSKLATTCTALNNDLSQLAQVNQSLTTSSGTNNSLLDQRDKLLDDISKYVPITTTLSPNGTATINTGSVTLVNSTQQAASFSITASTDASNPATIQVLDSNNNVINSNANAMMGNGQIGAILQIGGYDSTSSSLSIGGVLNSLNTMARSFAQSVNDLQTSSTTDNSGNVTQAVGLNSTGTALAPPTTDPATGLIDPENENNSIFVYQDGQNMVDGNANGNAATDETADYQNLTAANITVNSTIVNNPYDVAAATVIYPYATGITTSQLSGTGDGSNALAISNLSSTGLSSLGGLTTEDYLSGAVTTIGSQVAGLSTSYDTASATAAQTQTNRQSTGGVSLDEELTNLTVFQRTYEAAAQVMSDINTSLQKILSIAS